MPIPRLLILPLIPFVLFACQGTEAPPVDRSGYAELFQVRDLALLTAVDRIEDERHLAAAPWLLWIQRNEARNLPERSRAAAALSRLGIAEGQAFCLAILGAWLPGHETQSQRYGIHRSERMAFARELALLALQERAVHAKRTPPRYDVNQGASQMVQSVQAWQELLAELPASRPDSKRLTELYPKIPPAEWTRTRESWTRLRSDIRDGSDPASVGTESSPSRGQRR